MKKKLIFFIFFFIFLVFSLVVYSGDYMEYLTKGFADTLYCKLIGCQMQGDIDMGGYNLINATYIAMNRTNASQICLNGWCIGTWIFNTSIEIFNAVNNGSFANSQDLQNNISNLMNYTNSTYLRLDTSNNPLTGNLTINTGVDEDASLAIQSGVNQHSYLYLKESDNLGFSFWYDGSGTNYFNIDSWDVLGNINTRLRIARLSGITEIFNNLSLQDSNAYDVNCISFTDGTIQCTALNSSFNASYVSENYPTNLNLQTNLSSLNESAKQWVYNGTLQQALKNSSNITVQGDTIFFNGTIPPYFNWNYMDWYNGTQINNSIGDKMFNGSLQPAGNYLTTSSSGWTNTTNTTSTLLNVSIKTGNKMCLNENCSSFINDNEMRLFNGGHITRVIDNGTHTVII